MLVLTTSSVNLVNRQYDRKMKRVAILRTELKKGPLQIIVKKKCNCNGSNTCIISQLIIPVFIIPNILLRYNGNFHYWLKLFTVKTNI